MNFDDIQKTWQSPHNQPSAAHLEQEKMKFFTDLRQRNRNAVLFLVVMTSLLAFFTGKMIFQLLWPDPSKDTIDLSREWAILPLLALPWLCIAVYYFKYRRYRGRHPNGERSIRAGLRALLDENRLASERHKWGALICILSLPLMPLIVNQLQAVGKAGDEIVIPAFVILPIIMLCVLLGMVWHQRRVLLPRRRELEGLLETYREP